MTREEFLNSILTKKQIADIKCAIKQSRENRFTRIS